MTKKINVLKPLKLLDGSSEKNRELPSNLQAEQNLLGAILIDNSLIDSLPIQLKLEHFFDPLHGKIFESIYKIYSRGQLANPVTIKSFISDTSIKNEFDVQEYLDDLVDGAISISESKDYCSTIHDAYLRRELVKLSDHVIYKAQNPNVDEIAKNQIEDAEQKLFNLAEFDETDKGLKSFDKTLETTIKFAENASKSEGNLSGISTGLTGLNERLGGLHRSDLIILAGRPGMGKTALATNIAFHAASTTRTGEKSVPVAFFSLEMSAEQLGMRILAERSNISSDAIRKGKIKKQDLLSLVEATSEIENTPFFIDDTAALTTGQIASRARRLKRTHGLGLIVIDYLQLIKDDKSTRAEFRVQEMTSISRSLKTLAKDIDVPVIALSQLSRAVELRDDKKPILPDLRESGSIEQDADVVMFVYREEYYLDKNEPTRKQDENEDKYNLRHQIWKESLEKASGKAEIIIGKQRHGPLGRVDLSFNGRLTKFSDLISDEKLPEY